MAFPLAELSARTDASAQWVRARWARLLAAVEAYPLERIGLAAVAAGIMLRLAAPFLMDFRSDGDTYVAMGHAWMMHHSFLMPYGDVPTWGPGSEDCAALVRPFSESWMHSCPNFPSNHYPPAYPFYLGVVFSIFGYGLWVAKWAAVAISIGALVAVYFTTRDLYGRVAAALATGLLALEPHLLWVTGSGFSENMVLLFFALTMWAIVRSLQDDRYIVLAGLFAGLAYLSRASVGYFFVIAGAGGFVWRLMYRGWRIFLNPWYMIAIGVFVGIVGAWAARNIYWFGTAPEDIPRLAVVQFGAIGLLASGVILALPFVVRRERRTWLNLFPAVVSFGAGMLLSVWLLLYHGTGLGAGYLEVVHRNVPWPLWETSSYTRWVQEYAFERPELWRKALLAKIPLFLAFLAWYAIPFLPESWKATKRVREEETSALWLSVALLWVIAWIFTSMFWVFEQSSLYWLDNHRYAVIGLLPLAWLLLREARTERASFRARYGLLLASLFVACAATIVSPVKFSDLRAAEHMDPYLRPGDEVAVDGGTIKYAFYAYLTKPETIQIYGWTDGREPDFVVSLKGTWNWERKLHDCQPYEGYTLVGSFHQRFWTGGVMSACLHATPEVVAERGIPVGTVVVDG